MPIKSLYELYQEHQGKVSDKWLGYFEAYSHALSSYRDQSVSLLEIGVQNGGSLEIWGKFFSSAEVIMGCDINPACAHLQFDDPRIRVVVGDAVQESTKSLILIHSNNFDIVIDDGSHSSADIIRAFFQYFPLIKDGGVFVAEDLHCSYWGEFGGGLYYPYSSIAFFKRLADVINFQHIGVGKSRADLVRGILQNYDIECDYEALEHIHSIEFINSVCIVRKRASIFNMLGRRIVAGCEEAVVPGHFAVADTVLQPTTQAKNYWSTMVSAPEELYESLIKKMQQQAKKISHNNEELRKLQKQVLLAEKEIAILQKSLSWRITSPLRVAAKPVFGAVVWAKSIRSVIDRNGGVLKTTKLAMSILHHRGLSSLLHTIKRASTHKPSIEVNVNYGFDRNHYTEWVCHSDTLSDADRQRMLDTLATFTVKPLISVVMPTYNPKPEWLIEAIESVRGQIYPHWELCIADDASTDPAIRPILEYYSAQDERIKVVFRKKNGHISAASNSALEIATGDYLALLDHDDELTVDALYWNVREILMHPAADVIYSDEDKISPDGEKTDEFFKPDWSPELMFNCMYIGHLTVYKKTLIDKIGGFRSEYDYSQDYDMALRATEVAVEIRHISRILYHWRQAEGSAAQGGKPYARISNIAALQAAIDRRRIAAKVIDLPTANRVKIIGWQPKVSIIIPTDSVPNLITCLDQLAAMTEYQSWEVVVVTNSRVVDQFVGKYGQLQLRFCCYDKPYNFSDKCNMGGREAKGDVVVFFNDDVRPLHSSWLEDLIELLAVPGVGAVSPKLIYEDHRIQHAGLVSGVRGLVGTAFHCLPESTTEYFCFAQSVRNVSALSGACFAMLRKVFLDVGGFDAVNTPIMHSDVDLSFKIREAGFRCVYTPHAKLLHIGHQSLSEFDKKKEKDSQDKADIFLLKQWGGYLSYDPYFTDPMRACLFRDSPEVYGMFGVNAKNLNEHRPDVLIVTHDFSGSGAPMVAYFAAKHLLAAGAFPVVASPEDGPMRKLFELLGVPIIIDSLLLKQHSSVLKLAGNFDCVLANTLIAWPIVYQMINHPTPVLWYLHESHLISEMAESNQMVRKALQSARNLFVGSERSATFCRKFNQNVNVLSYGVPDLFAAVNESNCCDRRIVFSVFGSIEPRKGQDVFLDAIRLINARLGEKAVFNVIGRSMSHEWINDRRIAMQGMKNVIFHGPVDYECYRELLSETDVVVCPSRDDTLPLVSLDALSMGKILICTVTTGTSGFLVDGRDGLVIPSEEPRALASVMADILENPGKYASVGVAARKVYLENFSENKFSERIVSAVRAVARVS